MKQVVFGLLKFGYQDFWEGEVESRELIYSTKGAQANKEHKAISVTVLIGICPSETTLDLECGTLGSKYAGIGWF